jgi:3-deoxy-D-manno-octulosonate 8-phosphate phosphatase KdsC-like HAD superfamily phosphatase
MPDEVERDVSIQTATAIAAVAEMVRDIEDAGSLEVGFDRLAIALEALDELISTLEDNLGLASESVLFLGDILLPDDAVEDADDAGQSAQALEAAVNFVTANIGGEVSDRALVEFLLREARQAQRALTLARVAAENQDADLMRLAVLRFDRFTYAAVSYSVVWSLVPLG